MTLEMLLGIKLIYIYSFWLCIVVVMSLCIKFITRSWLFAIYVFELINAFNMFWGIVDYDYAFLYPVLWSIIIMVASGIVGFFWIIETGNGAVK